MNTSHFKNKKSNNNKGFYIALSICIATVGATAISTFDTFKNHTKKKDEKISDSPSQSIQQPANSEMHGITIAENNNQLEFEPQDFFSDSESASFNETEESEVTVNSTVEQPLVVYPCSKEILKEYSGDNPVFSSTLNDWRIHSGVDFKTEDGEKVVAITNGTVTDIIEDPILGTTVIIDHSNGVTASYSGLDQSVNVNKDDHVEANQEIGTIGKIPGEYIDGPHLHFSVKKDGKYVNPIEILS